MSSWKCVGVSTVVLCIISTVTAENGGGAEEVVTRKCIDGSAPNVFGPVLDSKQGVRCGENLDGEEGRCPYGTCCSRWSYCGPRAGPDGNFHAGGYSDGPIISYEASQALYCEKNQGDWRYIPCDAEGAVQVWPHREEPEGRTLADILSESGSILEMLIEASDAIEFAAALRGDDLLTVFAPTEEALLALPDGVAEELLDPENRDFLEAIVKHHGVEGAHTTYNLLAMTSVTTLSGEEVFVSREDDGNVLINDAIVVEADVIASNGVVHFIDKIILPPRPAPELDTVYQVAKMAGLDTFLLALEMAGGSAIDDLKDPDFGPATIFMPTNAAFDALPDGVLADLLLPENIDELHSLLRYHIVIDKRVLATELSSMTEIENEAGKRITIGRTPSGQITVDRIVIVGPDTVANNGVIHIIDQVMSP